MIPKGKLLIIGGAEDKGESSKNPPEIKGRNKDFKHYEILGELIPPDRHEHHRIEVITTASSIPMEMGKMYVKAYKKAGFNNIHHIKIDTKEEARDPEHIRRVNDAHAILFSGGDQFRLSTILGDTPVLKAIIKKYHEEPNFIVAGTSAGAMAMSRLMIYQSEINEAMLKGDVKISSGFGVLDNCIIDTHFVKRGRFSRLAQAVIMNPNCIGIGLGEDTALVIAKGNEAECRGSGMVVIIDAREIGHTNITYTEEARAICVENLKVHVLAKGNGFLLKERKFIPEKPLLEEPGASNE